jgi:hypothetical protein
MWASQFGDSIAMRGARDREGVPGCRTLAAGPISHAKVLELVRLGLKVHDISGLLGVHPRVVKRGRGAARRDRARGRGAAETGARFGVEVKCRDY